MSTQIVVPALGESVTEATIAKWFKQVGDAVAADEPLVELETDKVTVEVNAPASGTLVEIAAAVGTTVGVGAPLGEIDASGAPAKAKPAAAPAPSVAAPAVTAEAHPPAPSARKLMEENRLDAGAVTGTGKDGRITKGDVIATLERPAAPAAAPVSVPAAPRAADPREERVKMTRLRKRIAQRLKEAQNNAAMLTTFNEVDMSAINAIRAQYKESFEKKHGVKLGFMSFFVKASVAALKEWPAVNAEIDGDDLVYKNYYDIGVAVGTPNGLVVPVVRNADTLSFAEVEKTIGNYGRKARDGKLTIDEMTGGTFTVSNGGVYGSLMSTPIINPPQSAILGMHKTQLRPVVLPDGRIEARPMMYLAVSYDHRIIDGREAVSFLIRIKECLEDPQRILLDM
ncbi:2-oxoglutarate dehydrogenase complex dihydrolipoyllysine-residue succinyltransferase [Telmatospirillum sp.]|uniref:2-oxoglutarate dehydrogenase complex dihydrolipoyllysine-residue succinyltransferase n=1 Tax=Telmatospirillum sp. TaxID=2079197 RepID=UPI00283AC048|nr:2-oxoglutarate dehydrogenase complex dihydrolipoyllysine-residue succinyltransferase [Telmatospirillum sp.]MDR3441090.1 2-oxoglutarate dehydrogenase complex dihydrolipoyllysine-residue succinyltransferase [Telmatospirillum sp.]